jgi:hypothetical protein
MPVNMKSIDEKSGRPARINRIKTVSTKLTETEFAEAQRIASARGQWLSEWMRDSLIRETS